MKHLSIVIFLTISGFCSAVAQTAAIVSDCTIYYNVSVEDAKADPQVLKSMQGATKILYIKGAKSRSDLITSNFKQTILFDAKTDSTIILRELGSAKYLSYLSEQRKKDENKKFEGLQFSNTNDKKTILGYECKKGIVRLTDSSTFNVFYTAILMPSNKGYEYQFKDVPGFVLEYDSESENGKTKIKYTASRIILLPVPNALFDIPKSGYRVL